MALFSPVCAANVLGAHKSHCTFHSTCSKDILRLLKAEEQKQWLGHSGVTTACNIMLNGENLFHNLLRPFVERVKRKPSTQRIWSA